MSGVELAASSMLDVDALELFRPRMTVTIEYRNSRMIQYIDAGLALYDSRCSNAVWAMYLGYVRMQPEAM